MKKISISDANQNFSRIAKIVDEEGAVTLTKFDQDKYVVCLASKYTEDKSFREDILKIFEEGMYAKYQGSPSYEGLAKIKTAGDITTIQLVEEVLYSDGTKSYIYYEMPVPTEKLFIKDMVPLNISFDFRDVFMRQSNKFIYSDTLRQPEMLRTVEGLLEEFAGKELDDIEINF